MTATFTHGYCDDGTKPPNPRIFPHPTDTIEMNPEWTRRVVAVTTAGVEFIATLRGRECPAETITLRQWRGDARKAEREMLGVHHTNRFRK